MMTQRPEPMTKEQLVALFTDLLTRIDLGDTWEGFVEWLLPDPDEVADDVVAEVRARYRVGNTEGQGGMRFIGELVERERDGGPSVNLPPLNATELETLGRCVTDRVAVLMDPTVQTPHPEAWRDELVVLRSLATAVGEAAYEVGR